MGNKLGSSWPYKALASAYDLTADQVADSMPQELG